MGPVTISEVVPTYSNTGSDGAGMVEEYERDPEFGGELWCETARRPQQLI